MTSRIESDCAQSFCIKNLRIAKASGAVLFSNLNMRIEKGLVLCLMGPSGCGKSTLLDAIAGHLSDEFTCSGAMTLNGVTLDALPSHKREVGILFQDDLLFPHLCVWQNLAFALPNHIKGVFRKQNALKSLQHIDLLDIAHSYPEQISGGQRARVSLMRMLLAQPKLALLDEPFSKLDKNLRVQFRDWVLKELKEAHIPTLMVTHDADDIPFNAQRLMWPWNECLKEAL